MARLDNAVHEAPYAYPAAGTSMAWKTLASPGAAKVNEFSMEDSGGKQGFNMNAGTDYTLHVNNNMTEQVAVNEFISVDVENTSAIVADSESHDRCEFSGRRRSPQTRPSTSLQIFRTLSIGAVETVTVSGSVAEKVVGTDSETVGASYMALAGMNVSRSCKGNQSLTVGGALITAAGVGVGLAVGGAKTEMVGGAKIVAAGGGISEGVRGNASLTVGGVIINAAGGGCSHSSKGAAKISVGGVSLLAGGKTIEVQAKSITITVGAAAAMLGGGGDHGANGGERLFRWHGDSQCLGGLERSRAPPNLPG
ncbi:MAG: hypothetical protein QM784_38045 [Polyangiaceae bacterium]